MKNRILKILVLFLAISTVAFLSCNLDVEDDFPNDGDQIQISGFNFQNRYGEDTSVIEKGNTVTVSVDVVNAENNTYTLTFDPQNDTGTYSGYEYTWTAPVNGDDYYLDIYATDGTNTTVAVCKLTVYNSYPLFVENDTYYDTTPAPDRFYFHVTDPNTFPATNLRITMEADPETGTITPSEFTGSNDVTNYFEWATAGVTGGQTIIFTIYAADEENTTTKTIEVFYIVD